MIKKVCLVVFGWLLTVFLLFLFSFTQIDLGLSLTRPSFWQTLQRVFQSIGYFQRPLATFFYLGILFFLFTFYFLILWLVKKKILSQKGIWFLILATAAMLFLAYNAFSYDLFNYIFDAKIVTFYHQNPYQHKALDFPGDPMLGFMHWTHRLYPYGPTWLLFTVPLSFLSFNNLLLTAILMKGLGVLAYLATGYFTSQILAKTKPEKKLLGLAFFAFNPLVVIESLVSAHNDILMMALILASFWFLVRRRTGRTWLLFFLSAGIKFATGVLLPVFLLINLFQWQKKKINWERVWLISFFLMLLAVLLAARRLHFQPWYLLYLLPLVSLMPKRSWLLWPLISLSIGTLLHYAPFFYLGHWDPPVPEISRSLTQVSLFLGLAFGLVRERFGWQ